MTHRPLTRRQAVQALGALSLCRPAWAADPFPSRPIRMLLSFPPGGSNDVLARLVGERLTEQTGQSVVVDNRSGGGGVLGMRALAQAAPDGYTIGVQSVTTMGIMPAAASDLPYDVLKDFSALSLSFNMDLYLVTSPRVPATTVQEFVSWARSQSRPPFLCTFGAGTSGHFAGSLLAQAFNLQFEPVHYKTVGEGIAGLVRGDVHLHLGTPSVVLPHIRSGAIRALATNAPGRTPAAPEVPTFRELGHGGMEFANWVGFVAPAKVPADILDRLSAEIVKATNSPQVRPKLEQQGYRVIASNRQDLDSLVRSDLVRWKSVVQATGFKL